MMLATIVKFKILFTCGTWFVLLNILYAADAKPQIYNENWILPPSRQESTSANVFQISSVWNLFDRFWSLSGEKNLIPDINASELIKRVGIISSDDENEWTIPPSRTGNHIIDGNSKDNEITINNVDNLRPTDNTAESWSEIIPNKIKSSIDTMTSELKQLFNATQHINDQLENARIIFVKNFNNALSILSDKSAPKAPKR